MRPLSTVLTLTFRCSTAPTSRWSTRSGSYAGIPGPVSTLMITTTCVNFTREVRSCSQSQMPEKPSFQATKHADHIGEARCLGKPPRDKTDGANGVSAVFYNFVLFAAKVCISAVSAPPLTLPGKAHNQQIDFESLGRFGANVCPYVTACSRRYVFWLPQIR